jgi:transcriptional regulator with XRE-family HTH domain
MTSPSQTRQLHRIATVRKKQGVSLRRVARQLGVTDNQLRGEEDESSDLLLSTVYERQKVLKVPVAELLVDPHTPITSPLARRAQMSKLMKTATAVLQRSANTPIQPLAENLLKQLLELVSDARSQKEV